MRQVRRKLDRVAFVHAVWRFAPDDHFELRLARSEASRAFARQTTPASSSNGNKAREAKPRSAETMILARSFAGYHGATCNILRHQGCKRHVQRGCKFPAQRQGRLTLAVFYLIEGQDIDVGKLGEPFYREPRRKRGRVIIRWVRGRRNERSIAVWLLPDVICQAAIPPGNRLVY